MKPKAVKFGVDFRCVFGMLTGRVLEGFRSCFGLLSVTKTTKTRKRVDLCKCLFHVRNIVVFRGYRLIWGARKSEERCKNSSSIQTQISHDFEAIAMIWGGVGERFGVCFGAEILVKFM